VQGPSPVAVVTHIISNIVRCGTGLRVGPSSWLRTEDHLLGTPHRDLKPVGSARTDGPAIPERFVIAAAAAP
jgi:hypothetical protein